MNSNPKNLKSTRAKRKTQKNENQSNTAPSDVESCGVYKKRRYLWVSVSVYHDIYHPSSLFPIHPSWRKHWINWLCPMRTIFGRVTCNSCVGQIKRLIFRRLIMLAPLRLEKQTNWEFKLIYLNCVQIILPVAGDFVRLYGIMSSTFASCLVHNISSLHH